MGANYSNVYDVDGGEFSASSKFGFVTGYFVSIPLVRNFGIQTEFLFSEKGFKASVNHLADTYKLTRTSSYIDIPVYASYKPSKYITVLAGPQYSFLLQERDQYSDKATATDQEFHFKNSSPGKSAVAISTGIDLTCSHVVIGARANWGVTRSKNDDTLYVPGYKDFCFQLTLGYRF